MRRLWIFLAIGSCVWFSACCDKQNQSKMYLHIQTSFNNDDVKVEVDGIEVYHKTVTTNHLLGLADIDSTMKNNGDHQLTITVNDLYTHTEMYHLEHPVYLGIQKDAGNVISIIYSDEKFLYD